MQKIRKILRAVSEKTALPTNQPIITNNTDLIGPRWRRSNKRFWLGIIKLMHVEETDLKRVSCLIRLFEEKQFMKSLRFELFGDILNPPISRNLPYV